MPIWDKDVPRHVSYVTDVYCTIGAPVYIERGERFHADRYDAKADPYTKTFYFSVNGPDGEMMDLFELQKWFDDNRAWIDGLKKELDAPADK